MPCLVSLPSHPSYHPYSHSSPTPLSSSLSSPPTSSSTRHLRSLWLVAGNSLLQGSLKSTTDNPNCCSRSVPTASIDVDAPKSSSASSSEASSEGRPQLFSHCIASPSTQSYLKTNDVECGPKSSVRDARSSSTKVPGPSSAATRSVITYLKSWQPPVAYYRRRRHHPSLAYPSRQPSLPALLEERITPEGHFDLVRPELLSRVSHHQHPTGSYNLNARGWWNCAQVRGSVRTMSGEGGWDDESDEDLDLRDEGSDVGVSVEDEDDDDDAWSEPDSVGPVTPINSPIETSRYFLQPLFLTKPPGC